MFSDSDRTLIGLIYLALPGLILPLYVMMLAIFVVYKDFRNSAVYIIMLSIGVADCIQLVVHMYSGIITLTENNFHSGLEKFIGGLFNASFLGMIPQSLVLALNRLYVFRNPKKSQNMCLVLSMLLFCWIFGGVYFVLYLTNLTGVFYDMEDLHWKYDSGVWSKGVASTEIYFSIPFFSLTFIVYTAVVVHIIIIRNSSTSVKLSFYKRELILLAQSFVIFAYNSIFLCCWHYYTYLLPDSPWTPVVINICWILFNALNPFLYLSTNSILWNRFVEVFLHCGKKVNTITVVIQSKQKKPLKNSKTSNMLTVF